MAFSRRWFLVLFTLILGGGQLFAASREERAYGAAVAAFNDKFYDRAEAGLTQFLQTYRKSTNAPAAVLLLAQSEFYLGKYSVAITRLTDTNNVAKARAAGLADRYVYWHAEAQFAGGDFSGAAQTFISLTDHFPNSPLALTATVEAAAAFEKLGQWPQADALLDATNGLFQRAAQLDAASPTVANGRLLQSESKYAQQDFAAAIRILDLLNPAALTPELGWKRAHQLYRANLRMNDLDAALAATTNLLEIARASQGDVWATNLAESVACRAEVLERQGRLAEASAAWREDLTNNVPADQQQWAVLKMAGLAEAQNNLTNAETCLENFLAQFTNAPATKIARLKLGELHLKYFLAQPSAANIPAAQTNSDLATAETNFDQLTNGPLAGSAFWDRGWCHWLTEEYSVCFDDFQSAARRLPLSENLAMARFKMGDAQFALTNYAGALTNYQAVLDDFSALPQVAGTLGDPALYQILRARLALHETAGVDGAMGHLLGKFFTNAPVDTSRLLEKFFTNAPADSSLLLADFGSPARVREVFRAFEAERADSPLQSQVAFAIGRTFERERNWPAALTNYQNWLTTYPTNDLRSQVEYARDWAVAQTGDEAGAFDLFNQFISSSTNAFTPLARWWVADHFFRLGDTNLVLAEQNYELIFQDFPTNELAYPAQLMAGRAAMGRSQPSDAATYFVAVINDTNSPADLAVQAKFGYCEALRQMTSSDTNNVNLQQATNILGQICQTYPTNEAGALAWSETGDCDLQLGALDAATNAYTQAFNSPAASQKLWCRAKVGLGIVLEKKAEGLPTDAQKPLLDLALENYQDVFYSEAEPKDAFWTKEAGLQMLKLAAKTGSLKGDDLNNFIKKLTTTFPQLQDSAELKRLALQN